MVKIKICGIKTLDEVETINKFSVSYAGFIFSNSKRKISKEKGETLIKNLRKDIIPVGVFVNEEIKKIIEIVRETKIKIIQLHGEENFKFIKDLKKKLGEKNIKIWKVVHVNKKIDMEELEKYLFVEGIVFETYKKGLYGGTGECFDWKLIEGINIIPKKILAGGINSENIVEAIKQGKADIIDVNSGVETNLIKDIKKINLLFENLEK